MMKLVIDTCEPTNNSIKLFFMYYCKMFILLAIIGGPSQVFICQQEMPT